ncbi:cytochrome b [bacterium]|nr:cytochrome b [bacterium]
MKKYRDVLNYSTGSKVLHWSIALIVIAMLSVSFFLNDLADHAKPMAYMIHKSLGLTVLILMIIRIVWLMHKGKPALPKSVPFWERSLSTIVQYSFYLLLIVMPLCGWIMSVASNKIPVYFGLFNVPLPGIVPDKAVAEFFKQCHHTIAWVILGLVVLHIAGAMKHYVVDKDKVVQRML